MGFIFGKEDTGRRNVKGIKKKGRNKNYGGWEKERGEGKWYIETTRKEKGCIRKEGTRRKEGSRKYRVGSKGDKDRTGWE